MKMLSRKLHNDAWTHLCGGAQHAIPEKTGAQILLGRNCNGMVLILTQEQLELKSKSCKTRKVGIWGEIKYRL